MSDAMAFLAYGFVHLEPDGGTWTDAWELTQDHLVLQNDLAEAGIRFLKHGFSSYPEYVLSITEATFQANPSNMRPLYPLLIDKLEVKPEWEQRLRKFAKEASIDLEDKQPGWYLLCRTGE